MSVSKLTPLTALSLLLSCLRCESDMDVAVDYYPPLLMILRYVVVHPPTDDRMVRRSAAKDDSVVRHSAGRDLELESLVTNLTCP